MEDYQGNPGGKNAKNQKPPTWVTYTGASYTTSMLYLLWFLTKFQID